MTAPVPDPRPPQDPRDAQAEQLQAFGWLISMPMALFHWALYMVFTTAIPGPLLTVGTLAAACGFALAAINGWLSALGYLLAFAPMVLLILFALLAPDPEPSDEESSSVMGPGHRLFWSLVGSALLAFWYYLAARFVLAVTTPRFPAPIGTTAGLLLYAALAFAQATRGPKGGHRARPWTRSRQQAGAPIFGTMGAR